MFFKEIFFGSKYSSRNVNFSYNTNSRPFFCSKKYISSSSWRKKWWECSSGHIEKRFVKLNRAFFAQGAKIIQCFQHNSKETFLLKMDLSKRRIIYDSNSQKSFHHNIHLFSEIFWKNSLKESLWADETQFSQQRYRIFRRFWKNF